MLVAGEGGWVPQRGKQRQDSDGVDEHDPRDGAEPAPRAAVLAEDEARAVVGAAVTQAPTAHDERDVGDGLDPGGENAEFGVAADTGGGRDGRALDGGERVRVGRGDHLADAAVLEDAERCLGGWVCQRAGRGRAAGGLTSMVPPLAPGVLVWWLSASVRMRGGGRERPEESLELVHGKDKVGDRTVELLPDEADDSVRRQVRGGRFDAALRDNLW